MTATPCPHCRAEIDPPLASTSTGPIGQPFQASRECPNCNRPLIFFTSGELGGEWRTDDGEEFREDLVEP